MLLPASVLSGAKKKKASGTTGLQARDHPLPPLITPNYKDEKDKQRKKRRGGVEGTQVEKDRRKTQREEKEKKKNAQTDQQIFVPA